MVDYDKLFASLNRHTSPSRRQSLVSKAIVDGANLEIIREMLDAIEMIDAEKAAAPSPNEMQCNAALNFFGINLWNSD